MALRGPGKSIHLAEGRTCGPNLNWSLHLAPRPTDRTARRSGRTLAAAGPRRPRRRFIFSRPTPRIGRSVGDAASRGFLRGQGGPAVPRGLPSAALGSAAIALDTHAHIGLYTYTHAYVHTHMHISINVYIYIHWHIHHSYTADISMQAKRKKQKAVNIKYNAKISKERTPNLA